MTHKYKYPHNIKAHTTLQKTQEQEMLQQALAQNEIMPQKIKLEFTQISTKCSDNVRSLTYSTVHYTHTDRQTILPYSCTIPIQLYTWMEIKCIETTTYYINGAIHIELDHSIYLNHFHKHIDKILRKPQAQYTPY